MFMNCMSVALALFTACDVHAQSSRFESISTDRWGVVHRQYGDENGNMVYDDREVGRYIFKGLFINKKIGFNDYYPVYRILTRNKNGLSLFREITMKEVPIKKEDCQIPCSDYKENEKHYSHVGCYGVGARTGLRLLAFNSDQDEAYFQVQVDTAEDAKTLVFGLAIRTGTWRRLGEGAASEVVSAQLSPSRQYLAIHRDTEGRSRNDFDADSFIEVVNLRTGGISRFPKTGEFDGHQLNGTIDIEKFEWLEGDRLRFVQKMTSEVPPDMRPPRDVQKMGPKPKHPAARKPGDKWENLVGTEAFGN